MKSLTRSSPRSVRPGDLTETITIEQRTRADDGHHGARTTWGAFTEIAASVEPLYVGERDAAAGNRAVTTYRFTIYALDGLDETMRIAWSGRTFSIRGIRRGAARELFTEIIAESGGGD